VGKLSNSRATLPAVKPHFISQALLHNRLEVSWLACGSSL